MARLIIHLGLPKTATTSLQIDFFSKIENEKMVYVGVRHPRKSHQTDIYKKFSNYIETGENFTNVNKALKYELDQGRDILISDEMIVVSHNLKWRDKLRNLYNLIQEFNYQLIVTVREPSKALFSYYAERFHIYKKCDKTFIELALEHESMKIYHYRVFFSYLLEMFDKNLVFVKKFEDLIQNKNLDLCKVLNISEDLCDINLNNYNSKLTFDNQIIKKNKTYIGDFKFIKRNISDIFNVFIFKKKLKKYINEISNISFQSNEKILIPSKVEFQYLKEQLKEETKYLDEKFQIRY